MRNRYAYRSKLSEAKLRQVLRCFALDLDATRAAALCGISRVTANRYFAAVRRAVFFSMPRPFFSGGAVELDESWFGACRAKGAPGHVGRFTNKTVVFGILHRGGGVYADIVSSNDRFSLLPVVSLCVSRDAAVHTDGLSSYDSLSGMGYRHSSVNHSAGQFANGECHTNGIESYWAYAKRRLAKFCGISKDFFKYHLKECEFRFNLRSKWKAVYRELLRILRRRPLFSCFDGAPPVLDVGSPSALPVKAAQSRKPGRMPDAPRNSIDWSRISWEDAINMMINKLHKSYINLTKEHPHLLSS